MSDCKQGTTIGQSRVKRISVSIPLWTLCGDCIRADTDGESKLVTGLCVWSGVILTGTRVKVVIPFSPGDRPLVGGKLQAEDQLIAVDGRQVSLDNVVELVRGSNLVGTKVWLW